MSHNDKIIIALFIICSLLRIEGSDPVTPALSNLEAFLKNMSVLTRLTTGMALQSNISRSDVYEVAAGLLDLETKSLVSLRRHPQNITQDIVNISTSVRESGVRTKFEDVRRALKDVEVIAKIDLKHLKDGIKHQNLSKYIDQMRQFEQEKTIKLSEFKLLENLRKCVFIITNDTKECAEYWREFSATNYMIFRNQVAEFYTETKQRIEGFEAARGNYALVKDALRTLSPIGHNRNSFESIQSLRNLLRTAEYELQKYGNILGKFPEYRAGDLEKMRSIETLFLRNHTKSMEGLPNGVSDLTEMFDDLEGKWLEDMIGNGEGVGKLKNGTLPLKQFAQQLIEVRRILTLWKKDYEMKGRKSFVRVEELVREIEKWKRSGVYSLNSSYVENVGKCVMNVPPIPKTLNWPLFDKLLLDIDLIDNNLTELINVSRLVRKITPAVRSTNNVLEWADKLTEFGRSQTDIEVVVSYCHFLEEAHTRADGLHAIVQNLTDMRNGETVSMNAEVLRVQEFCETRDTLPKSILEGLHVLTDMAEIRKMREEFGAILELNVSSTGRSWIQWENNDKPAFSALVKSIDELDEYVETNLRNLEDVANVFDKADEIHGVKMNWEDLLSELRKNNESAAADAFEKLKHLDTSFASHTKFLHKGSYMIRQLQEFFKRMLEIVLETTNIPTSSTKKTVLPTLPTLPTPEKHQNRSTEKPKLERRQVIRIVLVVIGSFVFLFLLAFLIYSLTPNGRKQWMRLYLRYWASQETLELYWRYSYWLDQESEKNALCEAIREVNYEHVKALVKKGAYINVYNPFGNTPLHAATKYGHAKIVKLLLKNGADRNAFNLENKTAEQMIGDREKGGATTRAVSDRSTMEMQTDASDEIEMTFRKYQNKTFRPRVPDLLPTMLFRIRIDRHVSKTEEVRKFTETFKGNVTDQKAGVTHFVVKTDEDGVFESDEFGYIMCVFLPTMLMQEQWLNGCLVKKSNFRDDYKFRVEKVKYKGKVYETVTKWAQWVHKQQLPYLSGVQFHVAISSFPEAGQLRQLVEMHGATWCDEMPEKVNYNIGSYPFHHYNLGPLFVIHDGQTNLDHLKSDVDKMYTVMTFEQFIAFMLKMEVSYDSDRKSRIPVFVEHEEQEPTTSRYTSIAINA
ncbi:unnamed protein product [Caenorhabditis sp. 36 PRJEB53466]|nr:unnamed protein product [Caenorhabditis sp. 36 PRJEB53466]